MACSMPDLPLPWGCYPPPAARQDPFAAIMLELALLIGMVIVVRWLAERWRRPPVLGEMLIDALDPGLRNVLQRLSHPRGH